MTTSRRLGLALIVSAPSGAGKSTLIKALRREFPDIGYSISCTTRAPRPGEQDGVDYLFASQERFRELIGQGHFAEWAQVHGNYYGTPKQAVLDMLAQGRDVLFDIDVQGARALKANLGLGHTVFVLPPSRGELLRRLQGRASDSPETVALRMENARGEIAQADWFEHVIVNDVLERAVDELRAVYLAARSAPALHPELVDALLSQWT
ncbi:Guanylate kinase [Fundidesulfovibrio magnetotacticus]|uniref:Guanylate kinase n=1 Tax=Fundidesulfovibrio magnetotacticus TaxID=2730080 RepID=A0A6V8LJ55_9BACT|nr:guanylate kinase [Fundidesulfovibrio magnetotacticus]GFK92772.1 Guanylate kinase [Fundidesulfovibrio magnetotacticus]